MNLLEEKSNKTSMMQEHGNLKQVYYKKVTQSCINNLNNTHSWSSDARASQGDTSTPLWWGRRLLLHHSHTGSDIPHPRSRPGMAQSKTFPASLRNYRKEELVLQFVKQELSSYVKNKLNIYHILEKSEHFVFSTIIRNLPGLQTQAPEMWSHSASLAQLQFMAHPAP